MSEKNKRIITFKAPSIDLIPDAEKLIQDATFIIATDIQMLRGKQAQGSQLHPQDAKTLHGHIKALLDIGRADKRAEEDEKLKELSTEDLIKALEATKESK